mgnify:CR=1 FL=1
MPVTASAPPAAVEVVEPAPALEPGPEPAPDSVGVGVGVGSPGPAASEITNGADDSDAGDAPAALIALTRAVHVPGARSATVAESAAFAVGSPAASTATDRVAPPSETRSRV